jgi:hypothetical protein
MVTAGVSILHFVWNKLATGGGQPFVSLTTVSFYRDPAKRPSDFFIKHSKKIKGRQSGQTPGSKEGQGHDNDQSRRQELQEDSNGKIVSR